jgi:6-pyruvoyltetrahydropterin/6-carboxytetrahydropterin synthase
MFRLTRQVRFALNAMPDRQLSGPASNGFAGFPSLTGLGHYLELDVTLTGALNPASGYLRNIKEVDDMVRQLAIPLFQTRVESDTFGGGAGMLLDTFVRLARAWPGATLDALVLHLSPYLHLSVHSMEPAMVRLSQTFEFSASHRLHNPELSEAENRATFGKCNNPHGHGHNYQLRVTLAGTPDANGVLFPVPELERIVNRQVIDHLDHRNLNVELPEFRQTNPSVEHIAQVIYRRLADSLRGAAVRLHSVTVWETPKTWCEYSE